VKRFAISENMKLLKNKKEFGLHSFKKKKEVKITNEMQHFIGAAAM